MSDVLHDFVHSGEKNIKRVLKKAVLKANEKQRITMAIAEAVLEERKRIIEMIEGLKKKIPDGIKGYLWDVYYNQALSEIQEELKSDSR